MTARVEHDALLDLATDLAIIPAAACGPFIMWSMTP